MFLPDPYAGVLAHIVRYMYFLSYSLLRSKIRQKIFRTRLVRRVSKAKVKTKYAVARRRGRGGHVVVSRAFSILLCREKVSIRSKLIANISVPSCHLIKLWVGKDVMTKINF